MLTYLVLDGSFIDFINVSLASIKFETIYIPTKHQSLSISLRFGEAVFLFDARFCM